MRRWLSMGIVGAVVLCGCVTAWAQDNVGSCGWGSKLFEGDKGLAPQVLAVTTNSATGSQTIGISAGTSGCTRNGVVRSNWHTVMFIQENGTRLAQDFSRGSGGALESLEALLGIHDEDERTEFRRVVQSEFHTIFPTAHVEGQEVVRNLRTVLAHHEALMPLSERLG